LATRFRTSTRVKAGALKARSSKAQGEGIRESGLRTLGFRSQEDRALKGQSRSSLLSMLHRPYRAFVFFNRTQGSGCFAAFTLGFAAARFQRAGMFLA
jgi:hypothetical protein